MKNKKILYIIFLFITINSAFGQKQISLNGNYGFCIPHYDNMWNYINSHSYQFDISFTNEMDSILQFDKNIRKGIGISFINFGNSEIMGYGLSVYPQIQFPLGKNNHNTWFILGCGLEYNTKTYSENNYRFNAIGSHFNAHIVTGIKKNFRVSDKINLGFKLQWTHFSNAANKMPNLGLNIPSIGLEISSNTNSPKKNKVAKKNIFKNPTWTFAFCGSRKQIRIDGKFHPVITLSAEKNLFIKKRNYYGVGIDIIEDFSINDRLDTKENQDIENYDNLKIGVKGSWSNNIGNLQICLQAGTYIKNDNFKEEFIYERLALRYRFTKAVAATISLRAHLSKADVLETGLILNLQKNE